MQNDLGKNNLIELHSQVDKLNEEVKTLALNLAIHLAKVKKDSETLISLEPEFIRLVNGTIKAAQEISHVLKAASNNQKMVFEIQSGRELKDHIEVKLNHVLEQCYIIKGKLAIDNNQKSD